MDLAALADFHLVAAAGGFGRASRSSSRPKATLSRRVRDLEESLGLRLIERGQRNLRLTDEGRILFERTRGLLREIQEVEEHLHSGTARPHGSLRVSAPVLFSNMFGGAIAAAFSARYPDVRLELVAEDRRVDLVEDSYDIAIRVNPHPDTELVGRCFARDEMWLVAPSSLQLPEAGTTSDGKHLVPAIAMIGLQNSAPWQIAVAGQQLTLTPDYRFRVSSLIMVRDAVVGSAGIAELPRSIVRQAIQAQQLAVWAKLPSPGVEVWVLHSSRRLVNPKVTAFISFLLEMFPDQEL